MSDHSFVTSVCLFATHFWSSSINFKMFSPILFCILMCLKSTSTAETEESSSVGTSFVAVKSTTSHDPNETPPMSPKSNPPNCTACIISTVEESLSTSTTSSSQTTSESSTTVLSVIIGVFALIMCGIFSVCFYVWCRPLVSTNEVEEFFGGNLAKQIQGVENGMAQAQYLPFTAIVSSSELSAKTWKPDQNLAANEDLLDSNFVVSEASYGETKVQIKSLTNCHDPSFFKLVLREVKTLAFVTKRHAYLLDFIGAVTKHVQRGTIHIVQEHSPYGSITNYLHDHALLFYSELDTEHRKLPTLKKSKGHISLHTFYQWAEQIADGMAFLHKNQVVHGELCGNNIIMFDNNKVKITNFAKERHQYEYEHRRKKETDLLSWRWLSIESLRKYDFSAAADVWSYGVTLWEIFSIGKVPYTDLEWTPEFEDKLMAGVRLEKPEYAPIEIYNLMTSCWRTEPRKRPEFSDIKESIYKLQLKFDDDVTPTAALVAQAQAAGP